MNARWIFIQTRKASTASGSFPFPHHSHPNPHQIFHLPYGASQQDIKSRYYELVRDHHPDSPRCRHLDPQLRHTRFQAITAAYASLTSKSTGRGSFRDDPLRAELRRRREFQESRRRYQQQHPLYADGLGRTGATWSASADDRWKDWVIIGVGVVALGAGLLPVSVWNAKQTYADAAHQTASANLAAARENARKLGAERREQIRRTLEQQAEDERTQRDEQP
ncbi:hypothetical protein EIP91_009265 [Steccherinum ochraceum]|uniref:J domain-containing protein n=1 Tax=Steccherinum ochraceum TaxID=92696 RepID=A0A4R0R1V0_9APHY|nr:hypothetical protein EIP91_009265 [Steccherinum ochraceum]